MQRRPAGGGAGGGGAGESAKERAKQQLKLVMFVGSGVLVVILLGILIVRWDDFFGESAPPPKKIVIDENVKLDEIKEMRRRAAKQFAAAQKVTDPAAKNKAIDQALATLGQAVDKLTALMDKYQGEEYDQAFEPLNNGIMQDMKTYREAKRIVD